MSRFVVDIGGAASEGDALAGLVDVAVADGWLGGDARRDGPGEVTGTAAAAQATISGHRIAVTATREIDLMAR